MIVKINDIDEYNRVSEKITGISRWYKTKEQIEDPDEIVGYSWIITDPEVMKNPEVRKIFGSNFCICDEFIRCSGKICSFSDGIYVGVLKGIEITEEDFYYVAEVNGKIQYHSCVGNIELA